MSLRVCVVERSPISRFLKDGVCIAQAINWRINLGRRMVAGMLGLNLSFRLASLPA